MRFKLLVQFEDGSEKVANVDGRDIRKWESSTGHTVSSDTFGSFTSMSEVARFALVRQGEYSGTWDEFDRTCTGVEEMEAESLDPTNPDPGDDKL